MFSVQYRIYFLYVSAYFWKGSFGNLHVVPFLIFFVYPFRGDQKEAHASKVPGNVPKEMHLKTTHFGFVRSPANHSKD